jgi:hypothetical protein
MIKIKKKRKEKKPEDMKNTNHKKKKNKKHQRRAGKRTVLVLEPEGNLLAVPKSTILRYPVRSIT